MAQGKASSSNIYHDFRHQNETRTKWASTEDERLHQAVLEEDEEQVQALLSSFGTPEFTNARDRHGNPPLHLAVHLQNKSLTRLLLESKADITWKNGGGKRDSYVRPSHYLTTTHPLSSSLDLGWTVVQEAVATRNQRLTAELLQEVKGMVNHKFEERIQQAITALQEVGDCSPHTRP